MSKYGLEARMTIHIVITVVIVSIILTAIAASMYEQKYQEELDNELESAIAITEKIIDIEISKIETAANTAAQLYDYEGYDKDDVDSILTRSIKGNPVQFATTIILDNSYPSDNKLFAVVSCNDKINILNISRDSLTHLKDDDNWMHSYINGEKYWSLPYQYTTNDSTELNLISYSIPITNKNGKIYGIYCSSITIDWLEKTIIESKLQDNIDVTVVADDGTYIIRPGEIIANTPPEDLVVKKHRNDRLGWNFIFLSPHSTIMHCVWKAVLKIVGFVSLLILILCISIIYNVRHVARPFVNEQKKIAQDKASMDKEVSLAANIQRQLLTDSAITHPLFNLSASLTPAKNIGGDLYDYTFRGNKLYFCIGDVSGKGLSASLFMAMTTVLYRHTINEEHTTSPSEIVAKINKTLSLENSECMFVTFFTGILNLDDATLQYCNAGHNAPVLNTKFLNGNNGMPMGIDPDSEYDTVTIRLNPGDKLLLYTDGVTEAMSKNKEYYSDDRLITLSAKIKELAPCDTIKTINDDIEAFASGAEQFDDITMLCINYKPTL
ncbi:SpoIIE family protein phosphatase [Sodaliphilus sp.]|uniref:SpoIIE family protein phosphatase n=1 Tax=Sodaliphilus sp. TaxID=2815818 RepID=UPI00388F8913